MHPITRTTLCALAAAAMAAPAFAAADYYLRLDDVKGGAAAKASGGKQLEIESWAWGSTMAGSWDGKFGAVGGLHRDEGLSKPVSSKIEGPLDRGSVRVKVKFPWLDCKVGAAFPDAVLQNAAGRYELKEVIISGCAPSGVALNYAKVTVRGWDPATKKE